MPNGLEKDKDRFFLPSISQNNPKPEMLIRIDGANPV